MMRRGRRLVEAICIALLAVFACAGNVCGVMFDDPDNFEVKRTWSGSSLSVPGNLGGMLFSETEEILYVVGNSEAYNSALYAVPITRDPMTREVLDLGPSGQVSVVFSGNSSVRGLDAGWEVGPEGTLFYTYWNANRLAQRPGGMSGAETLYNMGNVGLPSSIAGLAFSPFIDDANTGFGMMQVSVWQSGGIKDLYNVPLVSQGGGLFEPQTPEPFVTLPRQGTGAIQYIPSGPLTGNMMYVNWDYGEIWILMIDPATGFPIDDSTGQPTSGTDNPRVQRFAYSLGVGPWGLEFDPLTNDFFVTTWGGSPRNTIIQIGGAGLPPPELLITTTSLPDGLEGQLYEQSVEAAGGVTPYGWDILSGSLPDGLDLNADTGVISGTPTAAAVGTSTFVVRVTDSQDPAETDTRELTITINPGEIPPAVAVEPAAIVFPDACLAGENPPSQTTQIWNAGGAKLYWSTVINPVDRPPTDSDSGGFPAGDPSGAEWLTVNPTGGSSTGADDKRTVTFSADISGITEVGEYTAVVRFFDSMAAPADLPYESFVDVTVRLRVDVCAEPAIEVEPNEVEFPAVCAGAENPPDQTVDVWNIGSGQLGWTAMVMSDLVLVRKQSASPDAVGWLSVEPAMGSSMGPDDRTTVALRANTTGLPDGDYTGVVRFMNDDRPEEDFEEVVVTLRLGPSMIVVRSNIEAEYLLRMTQIPYPAAKRVGDLEIPGWTQATDDPKVYENVHKNVPAGTWEIEWKPQTNAWPKKPVTEEKILPGCGEIVFTKDYIVNMPSDIYQLCMEPINYATGTYRARVRVKNITGPDNPPGRVFTAPIWLVVKGIEFTIPGPYSEGGLWNEDGITSDEYPDSGYYFYRDVSAWAPLEPGEISPEVILEFYIRDRNPNFKPIIEVWADDPVLREDADLGIDRVVCGPSGSILVRWNSRAGRRYVVEAAENPAGPWREISNEILCTGRRMEWADSPPQAMRRRFYRIRDISP